MQEVLLSRTPVALTHPISSVGQTVKQLALRLVKNARLFILDVQMDASAMKDTLETLITYAFQSKIARRNKTD